MIIVAIDEINLKKASVILNNLDPTKCMVKIGSVSFNSIGQEIIFYAAERGFDIFLDLKLHDIPNTVKKSIEGIITSYKHAHNSHLWWKRYDESNDGCSLR